MNLKNIIDSVNKKLKGKLLKSIMVVVSGTVLVQIINLIFSPILTRIFGPEMYGVLGVFTTLISILLPLSALMYPIAVVLPEDEKEVSALSSISILIAVCMTLIVIVILLLFGDTLLSILNIEEMAPYKYIIPIIVLLLCVNQLTEQWLLRVNEFKLRSRLMVFRSLFVNVFQTGLGMLSPHAMILVIMTTLGYLISPMLTIRKNTILISIKTIFRNVTNREYYKNLFSIAKKYDDFPKFRFSQEFINAFSKNSPVIFLSYFFGPVSVGFFVLGNRILSLPAQVIGNSVGDVLYPKYTEMNNKGISIFNLVKKSTLLLTLIGIVPFGIIILFGPYLFSYVFGVQWEQAGEYARWLSLWSYFVFINNPSIRALPVINSQQMYLKVTIIMTVLRIISIFIGYKVYNSEIVSIALFSLVGVFCNLYIILAVLNKTKKIKFDPLGGHKP